jgi:4-hydroxybenzoate polyprenyltransferase
MLAGAFLRLIRFPNLIFIAITQLLFWFCIIQPFQIQQPETHLYIDIDILYRIIGASVLIAAGGYIINDYFDLNIDRINKPDKLVIGSRIRRRWAIVWHLLMSSIGLYLSFSVDGLIGMLNLIAILMLWFYSTTFKKQLLIGNVIISLLTAWVILILYVAEIPHLLRSGIPAGYSDLLRKIFKYAVMYAGFAFIISLVREVVKDIEDRDGDARYGCRTMPIVWGIPATRVFVLVWLTVIFCCLVVLQVYALQLQWWWFTAYTFVALIFPIAVVSLRVVKSEGTRDWTFVSRMVKGVMLAGILSMLFFKWYKS